MELSHLVAFVLGCAFCCLFVSLIGKRQSTLREQELAQELERSLTAYDELIHRQREAEAIARRPRSHS